MLPSMVASSWRMRRRRVEGKRFAKEEGVEARASDGKDSSLSSTSKTGSSGASSILEVVEAYVETEL